MIRHWLRPMAHRLENGTRTGHRNLLEGGVFYKSVPLPGSPTDITVCTSGSAYVAVFSIDSYGALTQVATSKAGDVAAFSGVAFSE
jgi:hypothetical protein